MMKTLRYLIIILATAMLGACDNQEPHHDVVVPNDMPIFFAHPVITPNVRALTGPVNGTTYPTNETFGVFCVVHNTEFQTWNAPTSTLWYSNLEATYDEAKHGWRAGIWYPGTVRNHTFAAYSPYSALTDAAGHPTNCTSLSYDAAGLHIVGYDSRACHDLMYSQRIANRTAQTDETEGDPYGIDLNFSHALACLNFTVRRSEELQGATIKIHAIRFNNIALKGTFNQNIDETINKTTSVYEDVEHATWTTLEPKGNQIVYYSADGIDVDATHIAGNEIEFIYDHENPANSTAGYTPFMPIPQTFDAASDAELEVQYSIAASGASGVLSVKKFPLNGILHKWEMGKRYTYNITIGLQAIKLTMDVAPWQDGSTVEVK